jgi:hypothetical protein
VPPLLTWVPRAVPPESTKMVSPPDTVAPIDVSPEVTLVLAMIVLVRSGKKLTACEIFHELASNRYLQWHGCTPFDSRPGKPASLRSRA